MLAIFSTLMELTDLGLDCGSGMRKGCAFLCIYQLIWQIFQFYSSNIILHYLYFHVLTPILIIPQFLCIFFSLGQTIPIPTISHKGSLFSLYLPYSPITAYYFSRQHLHVSNNNNFFPFLNNLVLVMKYFANYFQEIAILVIFLKFSSMAINGFRREADHYGELGFLLTFCREGEQRSYCDSGILLYFIGLWNLEIILSKSLFWGKYYFGLVFQLNLTIQIIIQYFITPIRNHSLIMFLISKLHNLYKSLSPISRILPCLANQMSKQSIEQTLRKSRQVEQRYKKFLAEKVESDKQWAITQQKIQSTLTRLSQTKQTIKQIDKLYQNYQKSFQNAINSALYKLETSRLLEIGDQNFKPNYYKEEEVAKMLKKAKKVTVITGAGVSAASGIPTFRDQNGFWDKKKKEGIVPEEFLTLARFEKEGENYSQGIWQWIEQFYKTKSKCKPNKGHAAIDIILSKLSVQSLKVPSILITQNIDNFHCQSNPNPPYPIYPIHGNILQLRCQFCSQSSPTPVFHPYPPVSSSSSGKPPLCPKCAHKLRPNIMFFDQAYSQKYHYSTSIKNFIQKSDLLLVIGTALQTGLVRTVVEDFVERGAQIVEINVKCVIKVGKIGWMQGKGQDILWGISRNM